MAYGPLHFRVANKILVAHSEPPALPIGSSFSYQNKRKDNKSGDPVNPIGPASSLFPLDFYNKICYYIKKRYKNTSVLA
nr:MAG TPA: hypothetical protein [Caudoviricetes sp.]